MEMAKVTSKGQITIPVSIRRRLEINEGDKLLFIDNPDGVVMVNPNLLPAGKDLESMPERDGETRSSELARGRTEGPRPETARPARQEGAAHAEPDAFREVQRTSASVPPGYGGGAVGGVTGGASGGASATRRPVSALAAASSAASAMHGATGSADAAGGISPHTLSPVSAPAADSGATGADSAAEQRKKSFDVSALLDEIRSIGTSTLK